MTTVRDLRPDAAPGASAADAQLDDVLDTVDLVMTALVRASIRDHDPADAADLAMAAWNTLAAHPVIAQRLAPRCRSDADWQAHLARYAAVVEPEVARLRALRATDQA